jgi:hypothetical protein
MADSADSTAECRSFGIENSVDVTLDISDGMIDVECPTRILIRTYNFTGWGHAVAQLVEALR